MFFETRALILSLLYSIVIQNKIKNMALDFVPFKGNERQEI